MNKILRLSFLAAVCGFLATAGNVRAQISVQRITFSLVSEFQTNVFGTNDSTGYTNEFSRIRNVLIGTADVVKAMAIDLDDNLTNYTWAQSSLVREVNLTNGNEGIFLRKNGRQTNVSAFFGNSFSNDFTAALTNILPASANFGSTNINLSPSNYLMFRGFINTSATNSVSNLDLSASLHAISFTSTNLKFAVVGAGDGSYHLVGTTVRGVKYKAEINSELIGAAGAFYLQTTTNFYSTTNPVPQIVNGSTRGSIIIGDPFVNVSITNGP